MKRSARESNTSPSSRQARAHLASLVEVFRANGMETAIVSHFGVRRYATSYGELAQLAGRFSAELVRRNIGPGERIVLWGENSAEWVGTFFGCLLRGVIVVPLDAAGSPEFVRRVIAEVAPKLVVGSDPLLRSIVVPQDEVELPSMTFLQMHSMLPLVPNFAVDASVQEETPFQIVFTSGTTSEPKGIVHTHRNVLANLQPIETEIENYRKYERWVHPLRFLHTLPLSHVFGQFMGLWVPAILSAQLHFADGLEPARTVDLIRRERISVLIAVPRILGLMRAHLLRRFPLLAADLEHAAGLPLLKRWWRFRSVHRLFGWKFWAVISGGAALPSDLERFWNQLGFALIQGYGLTETASLVTLNHPFRIGQGTIGKALPGREVRLSEDGEIMVRGNMISGATWQRGRMQPRQSEWLATGDLAEQNDSGDFRFIGRKSDVIVSSSGMNLHPSDMEAAMQRQPGVRACAVVPCEAGGNIEPVCVVIFSGDDAVLQQAVRSANRELADYQQIRRILTWPQMTFPYTSTGKLLRKEIKSWACAALSDHTRDGTAQSDALLALIREITGVQIEQGRDDLLLSEDLFLDSLARVQLASELEQRMGVEIGEQQIGSIASLGELRKALRSDEPTTRELTKSAYVTSRTESESSSAHALTEDHIYPLWPWSWPVQILRSVFLEIIAVPLIRLLLAPRIVTREALLPGPMLLIANHGTALDGALVLYALPGRLRRRVAIAMSGEMLMDFRRGRRQRSFIRNLFSPIAYWLVTAIFNVFPLPRLQGFKRSFAHAGQALDSGLSVLIFPEGTRNRGKGIHPFRPGTGLLAVQSRVPVLPIFLKGLQTLRPKGWFRSGHLEIRIGTPIVLPEGSTAAEWTTKLEWEMRQLGA